MTRRFVRVAAFALGALLLGLAFAGSSDPGDLRGLAALVGGGALLAVALWPAIPHDPLSMDRPMLSVTFALLAIFGMLSAQTLRFQVLGGKSIAERAISDPVTGDVIANPRQFSSQLSPDRGRILDRDGNVIAMTQLRGGVPIRIYPDAGTGYVAGYFSPLRYGATGIEASYDDVLSGEDSGSFAGSLIDDLLGRKAKGADVQLTLDPELQAEANRLLAGHTGAVVLIDVTTGAMLALASSPHIDPNGLNAVDATTAAQAERYWTALIGNPDHPLVMRPVQGLYAPGSTFKVVTASAALDTGTATGDTVYTDNGQLTVDGHVIVENNRPDDSIDQWTLADGIAFSLNVVLAQVGLQIGADTLTRYAEAFGFGDEIPFELPVSRTQIAGSRDFLQTQAALADTAFGQGQLLATPLQMAMIAAAIANGGIEMQPYLVDAVLNPDGTVRDQTNPQVWRRPVSESTASAMQALMINAVTNGYVSGAAISGMVVGGKTGTAEVGEGEEPHAWFIGFAGVDSPRYAVAVVLEHGGTGLGEPVAIGRAMLAAATGTA